MLQYYSLVAPSDAANHKFNLICHAGYNASFFFQKGLVKTALLCVPYISKTMPV